jgi:hypothetical protein
MFRESFLFQGDDKDEKGKKKIAIRTVELPIETDICGLSVRDLDAAVEKEVCVQCANALYNLFIFYLS